MYFMMSSIDGNPLLSFNNFVYVLCAHREIERISVTSQCVPCVAEMGAEVAALACRGVFSALCGGAGGARVVAPPGPRRAPAGAPRARLRGAARRAPAAARAAAARRRDQRRRGKSARPTAPPRPASRRSHPSLVRRSASPGPLTR
ncbi:unnamed protein product [Chrysodeixis includens]|uniref:Uncharacterized protein n=1 Tax=Chrysodeixis includens TaxID=689277 RepID=A0A9N8L274_CHRIL|nr:unnamed protein product [Chrysodeixis includens]